MRESRMLAPIKDPIRDGVDDDDDDDWCYGANAGGLVFWFGKYKDYKLHQVPLHYIDWCRDNLTKSVKIQGAISLYLNGVTDFTKKHYSDFIVPFGNKHQGQTIAQCRDKPWFEWLTQIQDLRDKYPYFLRAVDLWLDNPGHQEVHRDIGELLDASKYKDDLELINGLELDDEEETQADIDFLDDSSLVEGTEDDGNHSYQPEVETNSGVNTSFETGLHDGGENEEGTEADTSLEAPVSDTSEPEEVETRSHRKRVRRPSPTISERAPSLPRRVIKSKFIREAQYSDDSDYSDDMESFINDGPIEYEDAVETASDPLPQKEEVKWGRRRITKKDGKVSQAGSSSYTPHSIADQHSKPRKSQRGCKRVANSAFSSDNSDPPEVHLISNISKSPSKKTPTKKNKGTRAKRNCSEDEKSPQIGPFSRTLRPTTIQSAKTRKTRFAPLVDADNASDSDGTYLPEVRHLSSPSKPQPKKTPKRGNGSPRRATQILSSSRRAQKHREAGQSDDGSVLILLEESPRAVRRRTRNSANKDILDSADSYQRESESDEDGDAQEDEESNHGGNEIDDVSTEVSAKFSTSNGNVSGSSYSKHTRRLLYPSPPLTDVVSKWQKKEKKKRREKDMKDFVVPDDEIVDESDDFEDTSVPEYSINPHTPERTNASKYTARASSRKATSPAKAAVQNQTPVHRCYVELPPSRHRSSNKISPNKMVTTRTGTLKRLRKIVTSSTEDESGEPKRPRLSPINLTRRYKSGPVQSDEETVDGSVDGEIVIRGSSLGLSSYSPSKNHERLSPSKPIVRKTATQTKDSDDVFNTSYKQK
ncbi:hypothetical protein BDZ94DRAFT_1322499 [Collybia nuda]|uniref:Uncharacterized protein n=1 Tax=Collybia nuda TaxID=64659 RepID=A0A9P6CHN7_9AGAR|nr:hypothetical protein BDZ94DRAFT_1322499 [Collybia nuda]